MARVQATTQQQADVNTVATAAASTGELRKELVEHGCNLAEEGDFKRALDKFHEALQLDIAEYGEDSTEAADTHFNIAAASSLLWTLVPPANLKPENELPSLASALHHIQECIRIRPVEHLSTAQAHLQAFEIVYASAKLREALLKKAVQQNSTETNAGQLMAEIKQEAEQALLHTQKGVLICLKKLGEQHDMTIDARVKAAMANSLTWEVSALASFKATAEEHLRSALASCTALHSEAHEDAQRIQALLASLGDSSSSSSSSSSE